MQVNLEEEATHFLGTFTAIENRELLVDENLNYFINSENSRDGIQEFLHSKMVELCSQLRVLKVTDRLPDFLVLAELQVLLDE